MEETSTLVQQSQAGNLDAFGQLVHRFQDMVYAYAYSMLHDFSLAEDAAQEAFIEAYRHLAALRDATAFTGWLKRIVFTQCTRMTRKKQFNTIPLDMALELPAHDPDLADQVEQADLQQSVQKAIRELPEHERVVTTLFYISGYSHTDIAGFLEVPVSTVKSRLHTSRRRLKERMMTMVSDYLQGNSLPEEFTSRVITNVRSIAYGNPSAVCFIGSMMACLECLGDPIAQEELFALSGAALCFPWQVGTSCDEISIIPPIVTRAFAALGYEYAYYYEPLGVDGARKYSKDFYRERIVDSINAGRPVIGFGITHHDPFSCVITGYAGKGDRLYTRTYWPSEQGPGIYEPESPYCIVDHWYERCYGLAVFGEKRSPRLTGKDALRFVCENALILQSLNTVFYQGKMIPTGSAALEAMAAWILDDARWQQISNEHAMFLGPAGILLLGYYRSFLYTWLSTMVTQGSVHGSDTFKPTCEWALTLCRAIGGEDSTLHYHEKVDPAITGVEALIDPALRKLLAGYVRKLQYYDEQLFSNLMRAYQAL